MKFAIYDKATNAYLTKMVFEVGYSDNTQFECGLNEYITKAELLDTKKAADDAIARIENTKFMEKGRFVVHQFDDTLADQYVISEAGNPTKVVDNISVDLDGTINVKYGTMALHWSTPYLIRAITRLDALQKAASSIYKPWYNTFKIYKVITIIDEKEHAHYQFMNVTIQGLVKYEKDEKDEEEKNLVVGKDITDVTDPLNKRIEELEAKVESIKKEPRTWKSIHKYEGAALDILKDVIDTIYTDLQSVTACDDLKGTLKALSHNSDLDHIFMPTKTSYILDNGNCLTAKDEIYYIVNQMITILESRELNQSVAFSSAEEADRAKKLANDIIDIWEADDKFEITLKKFSQLYEAVNDPSDDDGTIIYAFKGVLEIFSALEDKVRNIIDESVTWKHKAMEAEKSLNNQLEINHGVCAERRKLRDARNCSSEIIYTICHAITDNDTNAFDCIESRVRHDPDFNSGSFMAGVRNDVLDICYACKKNIANNDLKNSEISKLAKEITYWKHRAEEAIRDYTKCNEALGEWKRKCKAKDCEYEMLANKLESCENILDSTHRKLTEITEERDKALEQKEFYKRQANSVYGMTVPCRCNGKQMFYDVTTGKKILVDKEKYDDLVEYVASINLAYDNMFCTMDKPVYLSTITECLSDLTT